MSFRDSIKSERLEDVETLSYENNPMIFDEKNAKRDHGMVTYRKRTF